MTAQKRTCRVGVHGRNDKDFKDPDYGVIQEAKLEVVKMMSHTEPRVFERIKRQNGDVEIITRLYDNRIGYGGPTTPAQFADKMKPVMAALRPYCTKFQVHNEPNHSEEGRPLGKEGWGKDDHFAEEFNEWFLEVYDRLKSAHPWATLGFPGLAVPHAGHRDKAWLRICSQAIEKADWLGVHCYWQTPPGKESGIFSDSFGLAFKYYHQMYPNKVLEILECGNSNVQNNYPISEDAIAREYVQWLQKVFEYPYVNSASFFILSSQDTRNWEFFCWRTERDHWRPVIRWVRDMHRPPRKAVEVGAEEPAPAPPPSPPPAPAAAGQYTNQDVINAFFKASTQLGMGDWGLLIQAGLSLSNLTADRGGLYAGPAIDQMSALDQSQKRLVTEYLPAGVSFDLPEQITFLRSVDDLLTAPLAPPESEQITVGAATTVTERRVARGWNRYGWLLMQIADTLGIDVGAAVAVMAAQGDQRGFSGDRRLIIRFEPQVFYDRWGRDHPDEFAQHFRFDASRPWQGHDYRTETSEKWADVHTNQDSEWAAFELAFELDQHAAAASIAMGLPQLMGFAYAQIGYESPVQMYDAFYAGDRYHVLGLFDFVGGEGATSRRLDALGELDFGAFAALQYEANAARYAHTLREAHDAFQTFNPIGE